VPSIDGGEAAASAAACSIENRTPELELSSPWNESN
jgi:hypothetical protein